MQDITNRSPNHKTSTKMSSNGATPSKLVCSTPMRRDMRNKRSSLDKQVGLRQRSSSEPSISTNNPLSASLGVGDYTTLIKEHFLISNDKKLLPGFPYTNADDDWERDLHDFFNLIALVPVVVLNIMNWDWDILLDMTSSKTLQQAWTGEWFPLFFAITVGYFVADLLWVIFVPQCVKSPSVIVQHHIATLLYLVIPFRFPNEDGWLMGACLSVEVNTWLLIARRVFNKQGFGPTWVINLSCVRIRIKLISILFYITWVIIRCIIYPIILKIMWNNWLDLWEETGAMLWQRYSFALTLQTIFCLLNIKWTYDLFRSKWRAVRSGNSAKVDKGL